MSYGARGRDGAGSVCFVTSDFAGVIRNGGIGTHFSLMSKLLADRGWAVHVLFCGAVDDAAAMARMPARLAAAGIQFTWLNAGREPPWWSVPSHGDRDRALLLSQWALEALEELHDQHRFDLIEFADWRALGFRTMQAKRAGVALSDVRLAVKLHGTSDWQRRGNLAQRSSSRELAMDYCERYAFEHADVQLSPTRYMVQDTRAAGWNVRDDVVVAYPFPSAEPEPAAQRDTIVELAFFGRLERRKGLDLFLDALDGLPQDVPALFLGRDALIDGRKATEIIAERIGERPHRIETELDREGALAELRAGDRLAVIASRSETFGFTVAECIANKIPFVAARAGGIPEIVRHREARDSWLFEPSVAGLANALRRRLAADGARERRLRAEVAEASGAKRWNDEVDASYRAALVQPPRRPAQPAPDPATVCVALTHRDQPDHLPDALAALAAQTRAPDEVLVIDDGSTSARADAVFSEQGARYAHWTFIRQEHAGAAVARSRALDRAGATYFLPLDAADIAAPELVETLLGTLTRDGSQAVVSCHALGFTDPPDADGQSIAFRTAPVGGPRILAGCENVFGGTCALFRAEPLRAAGGFEQGAGTPQGEWETLTKMAFAGLSIDVVPRVLVHHHAEPGGRPVAQADQPAQSFMLRRRMIEGVLVGADLTPLEWVALWESVHALGARGEDLALLQAAHDELATWANRTLWEADAWREAQLEGLRAFLQGKVDEADERARRAESALLRTETGASDGMPGAQATRRLGARAGPMPPLAQLWRLVLQRTAIAGARTLRSRRRRALETLRRR